MSEGTENGGLPKSFWWIGGLALVWNLVGVMTYVAQVTLSPEALAEMSPERRALYENVPLWATSAYAIATNGGVVGSVLLLLRNTWAFPAFIVSFVALVIQFGHAFLMTDALAVMAMPEMITVIAVVVIGAALIWYSNRVKKRGWLR